MKKIAIPISIIIMKDKREYKISRSRGDKLQETLANIEQHLFIRLPELGITINSTEIKEVKNTISRDYTEEEPLIPISKEQEKKVDKIKKQISEDLKIK
ncbi:hypothetical protein LCGC14_1071730 [marine sediment metagenome]|uniref:Uncharacterized protein n=1 Tax=marine sediment metagenome TaxID=412755 RepID=A0A0F9QNV5_9ZZZZ